jgi:CrcB protein
MNATLLVFLGAGIGGAMRHAVNSACLRWCGPEFPVGTMLVNVVGSLVMGLLAGYFAFKAGEGWSQPARLFATTGVLGGFTTFSAFSLDAVLLWERGQAGMAAFYVFGSVILSLAGLVAGLALVRAMT